MDLEGIMLSEISQTEKDKHCMTSLLCGIKKLINKNIINEQNKTNKNKYIDT